MNETESRTKNNPNANSNSTNRLDLNSSFNEPIDCLTLIHHDLNICTNSRQYRSIMELVNNLVLYFRPRRKQAIDKQKTIKFNLQLSMGNLDSLKQHIQCKQIESKDLLCQLRALEKRLFHLKERIETGIAEYNISSCTNGAGSTTFTTSVSLINSTTTTTTSQSIYAIHELRLENKSMEKQYRECKKALIKLSDELNISIDCYKEIMIEKRAANLAQTPLFKHVMRSNNDGDNGVSGNGGGGGAGETWSTSPATRLSGGYLSSVMMGAAGEAANSNTTIDLDQLAQQSILNNEIPKRYAIIKL